MGVGNILAGAPQLLSGTWPQTVKRTSWEHGLLNPYCLIDLIAKVLLLAGAERSLRARPRPAPGVLWSSRAQFLTAI